MRLRSFFWGVAGVGSVAALLLDSGAATAVGATASVAVPSYRCVAERPMATPRPDRPVYGLRVDIRPAEGRVIGLTKVRFTPDLSTERLVFRLWANHPVRGAPANRETVGTVTIGGEVVAARLTDATTLVVPLVGPAPVGQAIEASVSWELSLRAWRGDRISSTGFGLNAAVRLGSFFPILAWEPGRGWVLDPPIRGRTETSTTPTADFVTTVTVPDGLSVMATGVADVGGRIFTATAVRDVAVSVGRFRVATGVAHAPDAVQVIVGVHAGLADDPAAYVGRVVTALAVSRFKEN